MMAGAARTLNVARRTLYGWVDADPELKAEMNDQREILRDRLEAVAYNRAIEEGDSSMIQFLLRTVCRDRGYSERTEVTGADGGELVFTLRPMPPAKDE